MNRDEVHYRIKQEEAHRVQPVLGALATVPTAALVFGDGPSAVASGAPLYISAVLLVVGAYLHWLSLDATFYLGTGVPSQKTEAQHAWEIDVFRASGRHQLGLYIYGVASLACTIGGVAGVYGGLRTPVDVAWGFYGAGALLVVIFADAIGSRLRLNGLINRDPF